MNDTIEITEPKAWVGCLGCYNSGSLNGAWVDGLEAGDISKAVKVKTGAPAIYGENCPVCIKCGSDEFWVFDHEGYSGLISGECSPSEAQEKAELLVSVDEESARRSPLGSQLVALRTWKSLEIAIWESLPPTPSSPSIL
jgi:hypothetical protein